MKDAYEIVCWTAVTSTQAGIARVVRNLNARERPKPWLVPSQDFVIERYGAGDRQMFSESIALALKGNDVKKTVLIVDDNPTLLYFTARNLQRDLDGVEVMTAVSCESARAVAAERQPSVIVADLKLGDGSGLDLIEEMARNHPTMAAIIVSGEEIPPSPTISLFGSLTKPYEAETLVTLVTDALRIDSRRPAPPVKPQPIQCQGYDHHYVQNSLAGLLAGLRAFGADLTERSHDPASVNRTVDEYLDRLCSLVVEVSRKLPVCPSNRVGGGSKKGPRNGSRR